MAKILFIDDDESIRFLVQEELALDGHLVVLAPDGDSGLDLVESDTPDLVILDIKMPGLGGLEVLRRIKTRRPHLPVFMFTAYSEPESEAREFGADGYIVKSGDLSVLKQVINRALHCSRTRSATHCQAEEPTTDPA